MRYSILILLLINIQLYPAASKPKYMPLMQEEPAAPAAPVIITAPQIAIPEALQAYMENKDNTGLATWLEEQQHRLQLTHKQLAPVATYLDQYKAFRLTKLEAIMNILQEKIAHTGKMRTLLEKKRKVDGTYEDDSVFQAAYATLERSTPSKSIKAITDHPYSLLERHWLHDEEEEADMSRSKLQKNMQRRYIQEKISEHQDQLADIKATLADLPDITGEQESSLLALFDALEKENDEQLRRIQATTSEQKMQLARIKTVLEHYARKRMSARGCLPHGNRMCTKPTPVCYSCGPAQDPSCDCCCDGNGWFNILCNPVRYLLCIPGAWVDSCCTYCCCPLRYPEN